MTRSPAPTPEASPTFTVDVPSGDTPAHPVTVGCPFPQGSLTDTTHLTIHAPDAGARPLAARPLTNWPDGSVRWALLAFTAHTPGTYTLQTNPDITAPAPDQPVSLEQRDDVIELTNGRLAVTIARTGEGPLRRITFNDQPRLTQPADLQFLVDDASSHHGPITATEILERSPIRARVRVHGEHRDPQGARRFTYTLDIELWIGADALRLDYQFFNLEPGAAAHTIDAMRMRLRPALGQAPTRQFHQKRHGLFARPRLVQTQREVCLLADWSRSIPYVADRAMLEDESDQGPPYLKPSALQTGDWLGLAGPAGRAYLHLADMIERRPKRILTEDDALLVDLWPHDAGPLDVPQGRARRHTLTLTFTDPDQTQPEPATVECRLASPLHEGRATLDPAHARALAVFDQDRMLTPGRHPRFERYLASLTQNVNLATGLFDHGDGTEAGYTRNYIAIGRQPRRPGVEAGADPLRPGSPDALRPADPARYEPVWANNEYDLIHGLCNELMRTGRRELWPRIIAMARHNIEVDFIHYSDDPWQHHGSPAHSAYHNFASAYPSHIWTQGLLEYYCLTGDTDARDIAIKLGDTIIRNLEHPERGQFLWGFNREIGWALLALVQLHETTGETRFHQHASAVADYLANYDRTAQASPVNLSGVDPMDDIHRQIVGSFFGYDCLVEAMDRHARLTQRHDLQDWLRQFLHDIRRAAVSRFRAGRLGDGVRSMLTDALAVGYELTGDQRFIELGMLCLETFMDTAAWQSPPNEVKAVAMTHRGLVRFLHHADTTGLLRRFDYTFANTLDQHDD